MKKFILTISLLTPIFVIADLASLNPFEGNYIYSADYHSGLHPDAEIIITLKEGKRGYLEDPMGGSPEVFLEANLNGYEMVTSEIKEGRISTTKVSLGGNEFKLAETKVAHLDSKAQHEFQPLEKKMIISANKLGEILSQVPNPSYAKLKFNLSEYDPISSNDEIWDGALEVSHLKKIAKDNPLGYRQRYKVRNAKTNTEAIIEILITRRKNKSGEQQTRHKQRAAQSNQSRDQIKSTGNETSSGNFFEQRTGYAISF